MSNVKFLKKVLQLRLREMVQGISGIESLNRLFKVSGIEGLDDFIVTISAGCMALESARKSAAIDSKLVASAYTRYGDAFIAAYKGLGVMLSFIRKNKMDILSTEIKRKVKRKLRWVPDSQSFKEYLESSRPEAVRGESRISIEEKELLQLIVYGNLYPNLISDEEAYQVIEVGTDVICYGYITEVIDETCLQKYSDAQKKFIPMYRSAMRKIIEGAKFR